MTKAKVKELFGEPSEIVGRHGIYDMQNGDKTLVVRIVFLNDEVFGAVIGLKVIKNVLIEPFVYIINGYKNCLYLDWIFIPFKVFLCLPKLYKYGIDDDAMKLADSLKVYR